MRINQNRHNIEYRIEIFKPSKKIIHNDISKFNWYITTLKLNDPITIICIDCLRKFSKQPISGILIPKYYDTSVEHIKKFMGIPVFYIDTTIQGENNRQHQGSVLVKRNDKIIGVDEEHFRLIGHGVKKFPCCIIDADVWVIDNNIDEFILSKSNGCLSHRSSTLFLHNQEDVWIWDLEGSPFDLDLYRSFKFEKNIPFIHILSSFFRRKPRRHYTDIQELWNFLINDKGFERDYFIHLFENDNDRSYLLQYLKIDTDPLEHPEVIRRFENLKPIIDIIPENAICVELGSHNGQSALAFIKSGRIKSIHCIDNWGEGYIDPMYNRMSQVKDAEYIFNERIKPFDNIIKVKRMTSDAADLFKNESIDFLYIDASHDYKSVKDDILNYYPKVKTGGIISGHDYATEKNCRKPRIIDRVRGVKKAVDEIFGEDYIQLCGTNWFIIKS